MRLGEVEIIVSRPDKDKIETVLEKTGMNIKDIKCSICNEPISDLKRIRAIFPYHSALICCDKIECLIACRNILIAENQP